MNLRIITKNHAADPEIRVSHKIDFKAVWAMTTAWEVRPKFDDDDIFDFFKL